MFDAFGAISFITGLLPIGKAFSFVQFLPVAFKTLGIVAGIDANHDGRWSGEEKMAAAQAIMVQMAGTIPGLGGLDMARAGRILDHAVGLLNELTNNSKILLPAPMSTMPLALDPAFAGKLAPPDLGKKIMGGIGQADAETLSPGVSGSGSNSSPSPESGATDTFQGT